MAELLQASLEKLRRSSKRLGTVLLVVCLIALPVLLELTLSDCKSPILLFESCANENKVLEAAKSQPFEADHVLEEDGKNATASSSGENGLNLTVNPKFSGSDVLEGKGKARNGSADVLEGKGQARNGTADVLEGKAENITVSASGENAQSPTASSKTLEGTDENITALGPDSKDDSSQPTSTPTDKLLDGLLAPGFDEGSCLSRYQSYLYRKVSPQKPSRDLISKLRKYEDLHKRCGPHSKSYARTIRKLTKSNQVTGSTRCKYIVWKAANGLGNRMISMASTFLYAVLTDRVLMIDNRADMEGLFCEPFPNSSWLVPKNFPHYNHEQKLQSYENLLQSTIANSNSSSESSPSFLYLNLQHTKDEHDRQFHCDHGQALLRRVPAVILNSDQYFVPSLFMTPSFNHELTKMFPDKETVFHFLGQYLFLPSNEAWGLITRFYRGYLANADERIGLQVRVFNPQIVPHQTVMDQILACTLKHGILPEVAEQNSVASLSKNRTSKAILIASLYPEYAENLRAMYLTKATVTGDAVGVFQPSREEKQKFYDNEQNMRALAEMYLLSLCDVLVTSAVSTFGYVAQSLGGLKPWILEKQQNEKTPNPPCWPALSMEPCFHYPPTYNCKAKTKLDVTSVFPYTRPCKDHRWGVKLVNDHL